MSQSVRKTDTLSLEKELRLGRAGDNDVILGDRSLSLHHLKLEPVVEGAQLTNVSGHPNATFLDGVPLDFTWYLCFHYYFTR
ncbi:MAG: hypothetical protein U9P00_01050 [Pseudomonadota bacterium]|nr:hypothetical protein [Pseudomonadota bacterium]